MTGDSLVITTWARPERPDRFFVLGHQLSKVLIAKLLSLIVARTQRLEVFFLIYLKILNMRKIFIKSRVINVIWSQCTCTRCIVKGWSRPFSYFIPDTHYDLDLRKPLVVF
jgi:hypothetical protein